VVIAEIGENDPALITFLEAGAAGYLVEGASRTEAIQTLYAIHAGKPPLAAPIGTALLKRLYELLALEQQGTTAWAPREGAELEGLTPREREVLELIHRGASNQEIAQALTIELGTVKNHVHNILKKLKVSRREQAALLIERGEPADLNP
jgi:DNA-binding NarL/FixJ family response regulator